LNAAHEWCGRQFPSPRNSDSFLPFTPDFSGFLPLDFSG
jgi:hypothetical protein